MHTFKGREAGVKAAERDAHKTVKEREYFEPIFDSNGTNGACPVLSADSAFEVIRDKNGTGNAPQKDTLKKRMQRAEELGVLRKVERGGWRLNPNGTNGT